jgi:hypothetical protein
MAIRAISDLSRRTVTLIIEMSHRYGLFVAQVVFRKRASEGKAYIEILIDGRLLRDLARDAESESAAQEGHPNLAGKYGGLPWEVITTGLLLGESTGIWAVLEPSQRPHRVPLLLCECGEPGCWPLIATIDVTGDGVIWQDFTQPHRRNWDHSKLGPFTFRRAEYLVALGEARAES